MKKVIKFLIGFIMFNLIGFLVISFAFKDVIQKQIMGEIIKKEVLPEALKVDKEKQELLNEILNDEKTSEMINNLLDNFIDSIGNDKPLNKDVIDELYNYIIENKEIITSVTNEDIDTTKLKDFQYTDEYKEFTTDLVENFSSVNNNLGSFEKSIIKIYSIITSNVFRISLIIGIIICIVLIMIIDKSLYSFLNPLGISLISSSIFLILLYVVSLFLIDYIVNNSNIKIEINTLFLLISGILLFIIGIISKIIYKILCRKNID